MKRILLEIATCLVYATFPAMAVLAGYLGVVSLDSYFNESWLFFRNWILGIGIFFLLGAIAAMLCYFFLLFRESLKDQVKKVNKDTGESE